MSYICLSKLILQILVTRNLVKMVAPALSLAAALVAAVQSDTAGATVRQVKTHYINTFRLLWCLVNL